MVYIFWSCDSNLALWLDDRPIWQIRQCTYPILHNRSFRRGMYTVCMADVLYFVLCFSELNEIIKNKVRLCRVSVYAVFSLQHCNQKSTIANVIMAHMILHIKVTIYECFYDIHAITHGDDYWLFTHPHTQSYFIVSLPLIEYITLPLNVLMKHVLVI